MTEKDVNDAIKIIQKYCKEQEECLSCPMFINCNNIGAPVAWKLVEERSGNK